MNELSNYDLVNIITDRKLDHYFGGGYSKHQLPKELISETCRGHWFIRTILVYLYNKPLTSTCFDSYGFIAPTETQEK